MAVSPIPDIGGASAEDAINDPALLNSPLEEEGKKDDDYQEDAYPEFKLPESMRLKPGQETKTLCTIRGKDNGMGCLVAIRGVDLAKSQSTEEPEMESGGEEEGMDDGKDAGDRFMKKFGRGKYQQTAQY